MGTCRLKAEPIKRHNVSKRHLLHTNKHYLKDTGLKIATKRALIWDCCKAVLTTVSHGTMGIWIIENVFISFGLKSLRGKNMEAPPEILKLCNFTGTKHQQELHQRSHLPSAVSNTVKPSHQTAVSKVTNTTFLSIHRPRGNWAGHSFLQLCATWGSANHPAKTTCRSWELPGEAFGSLSVCNLYTMWQIHTSLIT